MPPETSMSIWIPALHARMTESKGRTKSDRGLPPLVFSKELTKVHEEFEKYILLPSCSLRVAAQGMLRVLRGGNYPLFFGCGSAALDPLLPPVKK
jgi:hypothetical protein